jgi:hypothetical protein
VKKRTVKCDSCRNRYIVYGWEDPPKLCPACWDVYYEKAQEENSTVFDIFILQRRRLVVTRVLK